LGSPTTHTLYVRARPGIKLRDRTVERFAKRVRKVLPWCEDSDMPSIRVWCEMEYLASQCYAVLRASGVINQQGDARRLLDDYRKLRGTQAHYANALGMSPVARAALKASNKGDTYLTRVLAGGDDEPDDDKPEAAEVAESDG
jgi:hypothetical protein